MLLLLSLIACGPAQEDLDLRDPAPELEMPALDGIDLADLYAEAVRTALLADTRVAWEPHRATLDEATPGCPDFFAGTPDVENEDVDMDADGWSWGDHCTTTGGTGFGGFAYWEDSLSVEGDATSLEGATSQATRTLVADAVVSEGDTVLYELDGEASDSLLLVEGDGYSHWVYSSLLDGTMTGTWPFAADSLGIEGGWRAEMYVNATGGDAQTLDLRGNLYLHDHRLEGRFDSVTVNLAWAAPDSLGPDDCAEEPRGWIGVRDEDAYWYDIVFQPRFDDDATDLPYTNGEYGPCDGCGTLYVRGLEQKGVDVCPDLSFLWEGGLTHPEPEDFALSLREILGGNP